MALGHHIRRIGIRRAAATLVFVTALALPAPCLGQADAGFELPIEIFQGFATDDAAGINPYLASVGVVPAYAFGRLRTGASLSAAYDNPDWSVRIGPRASWRVATVGLEELGIGLLLDGEATWTLDGDARLGAGLTFDVDGLVRLGVRGGWDELHDGAWFGLTLGADPTSWLGCVPDDIDPSRCAG